MMSFIYNQWAPGFADFKNIHPIKGADLPGMGKTMQPPGSRFHPQDRSKYNVIQTDKLLAAIQKGDAHIKDVEVFHFTGGCSKPWECSGINSDLCEFATAQWWQLRAEVEA